MREPQQRPSGEPRNQFLHGLQRAKPGRATLELNSIFGSTEKSESATSDNGQVHECRRDVDIAGGESLEHIVCPDKVCLA